MKKTIFPLLCCTMLWLASCTPEPLPIEVPQAASKPVVATQYYYDSITQQAVFAVTLTRTIPATVAQRPRLDSNGFTVDERYLITGADVELTTSGGRIPLAEGSPGFYYTTDPPVHDHEFATVEARNNEGVLLIRAVAEMMPQMEFTSVNITGKDQELYLNYTLTDNPETPNWYLVNYFVKQEQDSSGNYTDPKYIARRLTEQKLDFDLFTDQDFTNGKLTATRKLERLQADTIAVSVSNITQGYHDFLRVQKRYGLLVNQVRGEVINFPSNVTGGMGYFNLNRPFVKVLAVYR